MKLLKYLAAAAVAAFLSTTALATAAEFRVAVEAPEGLKIRAFLLDTDKPLGEDTDLQEVPVIYFNEQAIEQRYMDKFYVVVVPRSLGDVVQLCVADVSKPLDVGNFQCALPGEMKFIEGYAPPAEPTVVHFNYDKS